MSTSVIDYDGYIWSCGSNTYGQLGIGCCYDINKLEKINTIDNVQFLKVVNMESVDYMIGILVALDTDGDIWMAGKLVVPENHTIIFENYQFTKYELGTKFIDLSCSYREIFAIDIDNNLWSMGNNYYGSLGLNIDDDHVSMFQKVPSDIKFNFVSCGDGYVLAIDTDGNLWGCGSNADNKLGNKNFPMINKSFVPIMFHLSVKFVHCFGGTSYLIDINGDLWTFGVDPLIDDKIPANLVDNVDFIKITTVSNLIAISANNTQILALDSNNNVWSVGKTILTYGELGLNNFKRIFTFTQTNLVNIKEIVACNLYSLFLDLDGYMWVCGANFDGQLNLTTNLVRNEIQKSVDYVKTLMNTPIQNSNNKIKSAIF